MNSVLYIWFKGIPCHMELQIFPAHIFGDQRGECVRHSFQFSSCQDEVARSDHDSALTVFATIGHNIRHARIAWELLIELWLLSGPQLTSKCCTIKLKFRLTPKLVACMPQKLDRTVYTRLKAEKWRCGACNLLFDLLCILKIQNLRWRSLHSVKNDAFEILWGPNFTAVF